jgi:hypothetical protein
MQRLVEQPAGEGDIFGEGDRIGRVSYHLSVYQHFSESESDVVPLHFEVEGRITPLDPVDLTALRQRSVELTLLLADGRRLDFSIANDTGTIRSTGRGLFMEPGTSRSET